MLVFGTVVGRDGCELAEMHGEAWFFVERVASTVGFLGGAV